MRHRTHLVQRKTIPIAQSLQWASLMQNNTPCNGKPNPLHIGKRTSLRQYAPLQWRYIIHSTMEKPYITSKWHKKPCKKAINVPRFYTRKMTHWQMQNDLPCANEKIVFWAQRKKITKPRNGKRVGILWWRQRRETIYERYRIWNPTKRTKTALRFTIFFLQADVFPGWHPGKTSACITFLFLQADVFPGWHPDKTPSCQKK